MSASVFKLIFPLLQAPAPMAFPMTTPQVPVYGMVRMTSMAEKCLVNQLVDYGCISVVCFWGFRSLLSWDRWEGFQ